jgi:hypothetical protein
MDETYSKISAKKGPNEGVDRIYRQGAIWISIILALSILVIVITTINMNAGQKDSLIYAKFITTGHQQKR